MKKNLKIEVQDKIKLKQEYAEILSKYEDNSDVVFSISASGEGLSYSWETFDNDKNCWIRIENSNTPNLKLKEVSTRQNGTLFRCRVSNESGVVYSEEVKLKVNQPTFPEIITQPLSNTVDPKSYFDDDARFATYSCIVGQDLDDYQLLADDSLETNDKTVIGAINEVNRNITESDSSVNELKIYVDNQDNALETSISELRDYIDYDFLNSINSSISSLETELNSNVESLNDSILELRNYIDYDFLNSINTTISELDTKLDTSIEDLNSSISELKSYVDTQDTTINSNIEELETKLDENVEELNTSISTLESSKAELDASNLTEDNKSSWRTSLLVPNVVKFNDLSNNPFSFDSENNILHNTVTNEKTYNPNKDLPDSYIIRLKGFLYGISVTLTSLGIESIPTLIIIENITKRITYTLTQVDDSYNLIVEYADSDIITLTDFEITTNTLKAYFNLNVTDDLFDIKMF